jgi:hypothetical protein
MIVDVRTYTMVPGRLGAWLALYEAEGMPIHVRHLGADREPHPCRDARAWKNARGDV